MLVKVKGKNNNLIILLLIDPVNLKKELDIIKNEKI